MQPAIRRGAPRAAVLPSAAGVPAWMRRLGVIALGCAALGGALFIISLAEFVEGSRARPVAIVLVIFALVKQRVYGVPVIRKSTYAQLLARFTTGELDASHSPAHYSVHLLTSR